ncbi:MAG: hypothetical protein DMF44_01690, partial [Verrucomicrobia bacterium]
RVVPEWPQQQEQDSSQRLPRGSLRQLLPDWSVRLVLQVGLLLELVQPEVVLPLRVLLAAAVVALAPDLSQAVAVPAQDSSQAAAALRLPDSLVPEQPDSYPRLPAELVPEVELVRARETRTRVNRDR